MLCRSRQVAPWPGLAHCGLVGKGRGSSASELVTREEGSVGGGGDMKPGAAGVLEGKGLSGVGAQGQL